MPPRNGETRKTRTSATDGGMDVSGSDQSRIDEASDTGGKQSDHNRSTTHISDSEKSETFAEQAVSKLKRSLDRQQPEDKKIKKKDSIRADNTNTIRGKKKESKAHKRRVTDDQGEIPESATEDEDSATDDNESGGRAKHYSEEQEDREIEKAWKDRQKLRKKEKARKMAEAENGVIAVFEYRADGYTAILDRGSYLQVCPLGQTLTSSQFRQSWKARPTRVLSTEQFEDQNVQSGSVVTRVATKVPEPGPKCHRYVEVQLTKDNSIVWTRYRDWEQKGRNWDAIEDMLKKKDDVIRAENAKRTSPRQSTRNAKRRSASTHPKPKQDNDGKNPQLKEPDFSEAVKLQEKAKAVADREIAKTEKENARLLATKNSKQREELKDQRDLKGQDSGSDAPASALPKPRRSTRRTQG